MFCYANDGEKSSRPNYFDIAFRRRENCVAVICTCFELRRSYSATIFLAIMTWYFLRTGAREAFQIEIIGAAAWMRART